MNLDAKTTALVLIDLQKGIIGRPLAPRPGSQVVGTARAVADRFRAAKAPVFLVHVKWAKDMSDMPSRNVDEAMPMPDGGLPEDWSDYADGLEQPGDIRIVKRQWGAFTGTALDTLLRRRGIRTIVLGGVSTNFGVESTARFAWELGYDVVIVEDACASAKAELHDMAITAILPRLSRIVQSGDLNLA